MNLNPTFPVCRSIDRAASPRTQSRKLQVPIPVVLLALPGAAHAHLVTSGLGPFYDGALHLLLSPADMLGLAAAALLAGRNGQAVARLTVLVMPLCWLLAGVVGMQLEMAADLGWLSVASFMLLGILVAADARMPAVAVAGLAGAFAGLQGLVNGSTLATIGAGATSLGGMVLTVLLLVLLTSAAVTGLQAFWARVAVRVAGSWVAAAGLMMLGWLLQSAG
jgi:hydrogenase/urease accessory protein HupE